MTKKSLMLAVCLGNVVDPDVGDYMTSDHHQVNLEIQNSLVSVEKLDDRFLLGIESKLRRHIYIEETFLFPRVMDSLANDIEYLEKEHEEILRAVQCILTLQGEKERKKKLSQLYDLLVEHNSFEESYIYQYYDDESAVQIAGISTAPEGWKSRFEMK